MQVAVAQSILQVVQVAVVVVYMAGIVSTPLQIPEVVVQVAQTVPLVGPAGPVL
jgi:hypothetical protein